jgi:hypothetical protein
MTGLKLSVSTAAALPGKVAAPSLLAPGALAEGGAGAPSLAAFIDLMIGKIAVAPKDGKTGDDRQDDAATGNTLPDQPDEKGDPALAWLLSVAPIALPPADPAKPVATGASAASPLLSIAAAPQATLPVTPALPVAALPVPGDAAQQPATAALAAPPAAPAIVPELPQAASATPVLAASDFVATARTTVDPTIAAVIDAGPKSAIKPAIDAADRPATPAAAPPIRITVPQAAPPTLAAMAPANAPMPALFALAMAPERKAFGDTDTGQPGGVSTAATLLTPTDAAALIAKPGGAERQALDMGRQDWPQKMIDRIEALRDDANANDTSIRLKPEALGRIDVSLRTHADGAVSVRFAAEQPTTRTLLADAAPQLNAAAEARGIRLTGTSVDLAGSGMTGGDRPRPQVELRQNSSNRLAAGGADETQAVQDGRVA